ncbi:MAG: hypothetical protein ABIG61_13960 [Planctomycetota bacterium]
MKFKKHVLIIFLLAFCPLLGGCLNMVIAGVHNIYKDFTPEKAPYFDEMRYSYEETELRLSSSAEVLSVIQNTDYDELLSQSESVIASWGEKQRSTQLRQMWFNMVAFDEDNLLAKRKYFFMIDEWPKNRIKRQQLKMQFDTEMIVDPDVLDSPYANENARQIELLKKALEHFQDDMREIRADNKDLYQCSMIVNQTFEGIATQLKQSPQLASRLTRLEGLSFDHVTIGQGRIRLVILGDIIKVKIKVGSLARDFETQQDVIEM